MAENLPQPLTVSCAGQFLRGAYAMIRRTDFSGPWYLSIPDFSLRSGLLGLLAICAQPTTGLGQQVAQQPNRTEANVVGVANSQEDPLVWLEDVAGQEALDWVRARNADSQKYFESLEGFDELRQELLQILDSDARIPFVRKSGDYYYNFWRDANNERGLWRRTTLEEFKKEQPQWETILDLDALGAAEDENWVWAGATLLRPDYRLALVHLSRGGADATVTREFDLETRQFVEGGFYRPEAKGSCNWIDRDTLFVYTDFGDDTLTTSGYARQARLWRRGQMLDEAELVFEGDPDDMRVMAYHDDSPGYERDFVLRAFEFYRDEVYLRQADGQLVKIDVPDTANKSVFRQYLMVELRQPWQPAEVLFPAGSLLVADFDRFMAGERGFQPLFTPTERSSLAGFGGTKDYLFINVLEDVKNRLYVLQPTAAGGWDQQPLAGAPQFGTVSMSAVDPDESNDYFLTSTDYLTPTTLYLGQIGAAPQPLKSLPAQFEADGLEITQHFATSQDGTRVPYFQVASKNLPLDHSHPTLLYGYGGFEISLTPGYNPSVGRAWTSQGGVYVVANIRGGGEYGPTWHQSALRANRLRAYEDFAAVAEDLVARGITTASRLGIQGGSNGGLLVGNMVTRYPELFSAAVCQVPLLDMRRYHRLLAGASWMAEYGNPDDPEQWEFIQTYSPYHNIQADAKYPAVLFTTSTRDDRVHPGHARKMMELMLQAGHDVTYYENIEGGHGGAANNRQAAHMQAMAYTFLAHRLGLAK